MNRIFLSDYLQRWTLIKTDAQEVMLIFPYKRLANGKIGVYGFLNFNKNGKFFHYLDMDQTIEYEGSPAKISHPSLKDVKEAMQRELKFSSLFKGVVAQQPWNKEKEVNIDSDDFSMAKDNEIKLGDVVVFKEGQFAKYIKHQPKKISIKRAIEDLYFNLLGEEVEID